MAESKVKFTVAVVGGGVFGSSAAIKLAENGFSVSLFEAESELFMAASGINQYRMHRGYHYPRSSDTIESCKHATPLFESEYSEAIIRNTKNYYAIANYGSLVSAEEYEAVLTSSGLPFKKCFPEHINKKAVEAVYSVEENEYDPHILKKIIGGRLRQAGVKLHLNRRVELSELNEFDFVVAATYASLNNIFGSDSEYFQEYQFEVCEKIVLKIPEKLKDISTVVMDGPFMSFDPFGSTGYAVMGHVQHAIHSTNYGRFADIPDEIIPMLNKGIIKKPLVSKANKFVESGSHFIPELRQAEYVGSMFTVRTVLPHVDDTDTRPTIVTQVNDRLITIYSGKVGNSVQAALDTVALIRQKV